MTDPDTRQPAAFSLAQKLDRAIELGYVARELLFARLLRVKRMNILFSEVTRSRPAIERWFRFTPHEIRFGEFLPETVRDFDLLVPLNTEDLRRLDGMRVDAGEHLRGVVHELIPR